MPWDAELVFERDWARQETTSAAAPWDRQRRRGIGGGGGRREGVGKLERDCLCRVPKILAGVLLGRVECPMIVFF